MPVINCSTQKHKTRAIEQHTFSGKILSEHLGGWKCKKKCSDEIFKMHH